MWRPRLALGNFDVRGPAAVVGFAWLTQCANPAAPSVAPAPYAAPIEPVANTLCSCACASSALSALSALHGVRAELSSPNIQAEFLPDLLSVPDAEADEARAVSFERVFRSIFQAVPQIAEKSDEVELCLDRMRSKPTDDVPPRSIHSKRVHIYDVKRAVFAGGVSERLLVLYSRYPPQAMTDGALLGEWRVAMLGPNEELLGDLAFATRIPYLASWETTDTVLREEHGVLVAHVVYALSCGAGKQAQSFSVPISIGLGPPCLQAGNVHHDGYLF